MKLALFGCAIGLLVLTQTLAESAPQPADATGLDSGLNHGESDVPNVPKEPHQQKRRAEPPQEGKAVEPKQDGKKVEPKQDGKAGEPTQATTEKPGVSTTGKPSQSTAKPSGAPLSAPVCLTLFLTALISLVLF